MSADRGDMRIEAAAILFDNGGDTLSRHLTQPDLDRSIERLEETEVELAPLTPASAERLNS